MHPLYDSLDAALRRQEQARQDRRARQRPPDRRPTRRARAGPLRRVIGHRLVALGVRLLGSDDALTATTVR